MNKIEQNNKRISELYEEMIKVDISDHKKVSFVETVSKDFEVLLVLQRKLDEEIAGVEEFAKIQERLIGYMEELLDISQVASA